MKNWKIYTWCLFVFLLCLGSGILYDYGGHTGLVFVMGILGAMFVIFTPIYLMEMKFRDELSKR